MKRRLVFLAALLNLLYSCLVFGQTNESVDLVITLKRPVLVYNNHVGNEWAYGIYINGEPISVNSPHEISTALEGVIKLEAIVQEDDKYPDTGKTTVNVSVKELDLTQENVITLSVVVSEDRGR